MDLKWQDAEDIAIRLVEEHPDADPLSVRFTDMHAWIIALPDFKDDPKKSNEKILETIQMAWHEEYQDSTLLIPSKASFRLIDLVEVHRIQTTLCRLSRLAASRKHFDVSSCLPAPNSNRPVAGSTLTNVTPSGIVNGTTGNWFQRLLHETNPDGQCRMRSRFRLTERTAIVETLHRRPRPRFGVPPINQALMNSFVVPVFPAMGRPSAFAA